VGYDGSSYGDHPHIRRLAARPDVQAVAFCPEHAAFGTPRALCDIHGGDGHDVLAGRARVLSDAGEDWTDRMVAAAREMAGRAGALRADLAVLMDISAACGSQVIYRGARREGVYQASRGVAAAALVEAGVPVMSQRDFATLERVLCKLDPARSPRTDRFDHHEGDWYRGYFGGTGAQSPQ
jgi:uncharacterized protein YbbK (DUF523 family)